MPRKEDKVGVLSDFDLAGLIRDWGCRYLVETGTGAGNNVEFAAQYSFDQIYSIESKHAAALQAGLRFSKNQAITIIHGKNERGLTEALGEIPVACPVIFCLGGHRPGAEFQSFPGTDPAGIPPILPLERILRLLSGQRDVSRDIFLIDDLRLYEDGAFEDGPCPLDQRPAAEYRHTRFVEDLLGSTHRLERSSRRSGYLCAYPLRHP